MLKNGKEAILVAIVTGIFSTLAIVINSKKPLIGIIVFIIGVIVTYIFINLSSKSSGRSIKNPALHPVFYTIEHFLMNELCNIPIPNVNKKKLVILYLNNKVRLIKNVLLDAVKCDDILDIPKNLLYVQTNLKKNLTDIVPEFFFERIAEWDNKYNAWTMETIIHIIDSDYYSDKEIKMIAIFDCIQVMIRSTIVAVENTINSLNGELDKYIEESLHGK